MYQLVGKNFVDFCFPAVMPNNEIVDSFTLSDCITDSYCVLFFYPLDFTFVCPTELIALSEKIDEFNELNTKVLSISVDSHFSHYAWRSTPIEKGGVGSLQYPMISDLNKTISRSYGMLLENQGVSLRGTVIIDCAGKIRHITMNDLAIGRSIDEILRILNALHHNAKHGEVCPADWNKGKAAMKPTNESVVQFLSERKKK